MSQTASFKEFIGLYPVQRTLRFELRPLDATKRYVESFEHDKLRDSYYSTLKKVMDDYYRYYIEETLSARDFTQGIDAAELYKLYTARTADKQAELAYRTGIKSLFAHISKKLKEHAGEFGLNKYNELIKNGDSRLVDFWMGRYKSGAITEEEYARGLNAIKCYVGYVTCLEGYKKNRDNIFAEGKPTSIADRIVQNMERYFENCINYGKMASAYPRLTETFGAAKDFFVPGDYFKYIAQSGIEKYNEVIGHSAEDINEQGVNQKINEYAQKHALNSRKLPKMLVLYKQILSESGSVFFEGFKNDREMLDAIENDCAGLISNIENITNALAVLKEDVSGVYVTKKSLTDISARLFPDADEPWSVLKRAISMFGEKHGAASVAGDCIAISVLQTAVDEYCEAVDFDMPSVSIADCFADFSIDGIIAAHEKFKPICALEALSDDRSVPDGKSDGGEGYKQVQLIKEFLDSLVAAHRFFRPFELKIKGIQSVPNDVNESFYQAFVYEYDGLSRVLPLYNRVRNHITTVTKIDKSKLRNYLGCSSLLTGWSSIYENNGCYIVCDGINYYLVELLDKKVIDVKLLDDGDGSAWKMNYYLQKLDSKNFPRVFIVSRSFDKKYDYPDYNKVEEIYRNKTYVKSAQIPQSEYRANLAAMIDYYKYALSVHDSYRDLKFNFKPSGEYCDILEFFNDANKCGYIVDKQPVNFDYLKTLEKDNKVLMFQIYSKDFSKYSHSSGSGTPNLHTLYFKMLFSDENIKNLRSGDPCFQLNGNAQIYTRYGSIERKITHPRNVPVANKNPHNKKRQSVFGYDLYKDKRFTETKMFLHIPLTINYRTEVFKGNGFNRKVNEFLYNNPDINVIGIDRGERHLLYYTVIDRSGKIIEQGSFNSISTEHDGTVTVTDYNTLLDDREKQRDVARKNWGKIDQIAGLKEGYLSAVVHKLCELMIKYNAVIVLENLGKGLKNSRLKVEKQVYQKFEHSIIDKLNYLVFKKRGYTDDGGVLMGYQLTDKLGAYEDIGRQTGFLFYIDPAYTSKICPVTGFVNLFGRDSLNYVNTNKSREFFSKFESISYNAAEDHFEFAFDYGKFGNYDTLYRKSWTVCTHGERWYYSVKDKEYKMVTLTPALKELFNKYDIDYMTDGLREKVIAQNEKGFFEPLLWLFKMTMQLRNTNGGNGDENDYILSPVADADGRFFDSRTATDDRPKNADANGAYHIALKGLWVLQHISPDGFATDCSREEWFKYRQ